VLKKEKSEDGAYRGQRYRMFGKGGSVVGKNKFGGRKEIEFDLVDL